MQLFVYQAWLIDNWAHCAQPLYTSMLSSGTHTLIDWACLEGRTQSRQIADTSKTSTCVFHVQRSSGVKVESETNTNVGESCYEMVTVTKLAVPETPENKKIPQFISLMLHYVLLRYINIKTWRQNIHDMCIVHVHTPFLLHIQTQSDTVTQPGFFN